MGTARCLVADDDPDLLDLVCRVVQALGAEAVRAHDGNELLDQMAHGGPFDVIIADVVMPWMTGPQALHFARSAGHEACVVVITASRDAWISQQVEALGSDAHLLHKPFTREQLCALVRGKLQRALTPPVAVVPA